MGYAPAFYALKFCIWHTTFSLKWMPVIGARFRQLPGLAGRGISLAGVILLAACASTPPVPPPPVAVPVELPRYDLSYYWNGDGIPGAPSIVIYQSRQRLYYYKGGVEVGSAPVGTGRAEFPTPNGKFKVLQKVIDYRSSQYGEYVDGNGVVVVKDVDRKKDPMPAGTHYVGARMPYFMRIKDGIGLHAGYVPGYPVSHGCIRLPREMARIFYENTPIGTPVTVLP